MCYPTAARVPRTSVLNVMGLRCSNSWLLKENLIPVSSFSPQDLVIGHTFTGFTTPGGLVNAERGQTLANVPWAVSAVSVCKEVYSVLVALVEYRVVLWMPDLGLILPAHSACCDGFDLTVFLLGDLENPPSRRLGRCMNIILSTIQSGVQTITTDWTWGLSQPRTKQSRLFAKITYSKVEETNQKT